MSKDIENIMREVMKSNKEIHNMDGHISKDITEMKRQIKSLETKIVKMDETLKKVYDTLEAITIALHDAEIEEAMMEDLEEQEESEDWTPYEDRNFTFDQDDDEDI